MTVPAVIPFQFEAHEVRIIYRDGEDGDVPWWVLADVCRAVGIVNAPQVADRLDDDEKDAIYIAWVASSR